MKNLKPSRSPSRNRLLRLLANEFQDPLPAYDLFDEFLRRETYGESFCLKLFAVARQGRGVSWEIRRLAVLMLEHQILKLPPGNTRDFDLLLLPNRRHGFGNEPYMIRRRWDYFVRNLLGAEPPKDYQLRGPNVGR